MIVRFNYNYDMEYCFRIYSNISIQGTGEWDVDEDELSLKYQSSDLEFLDFLLEYFDSELDIHGDIEFNTEDFEKLYNYCTT